MALTKDEMMHQHMFDLARVEHVVHSSDQTHYRDAVIEYVGYMDND